MRRHGLKLMLAILATGIIYTLLGSVGGSYLVEHGLHKVLTGRDERNLTIDRILFNPFTFSAQLEQLQLNDAVGATILAVDHARLDFSAVTLIKRRVVLSEVFLEQPELSMEIVATPGKSLANIFTTLLVTDGVDGVVPDIRIDKGSVHGGLVYFRGGRARHAQPAGAAAPFEALLGGIDLQIDHYQSRSEEPARLVMSARINQSSTLDLEGHLVPLTGALETKIQLDDLDLARFSPWLNPDATTHRLSGMLSADGMLNLEATDAIFSGELAIQQFEAGEAFSGQPLFRAGELKLSGTVIKAWPIGASVELMELMHPHLDTGWQQLSGAAVDADGIAVLSHWLIDIFGPSGKSVTGNTPRMPAWPPAIDALTITDGRVSLVDPDPANPAPVDLNQISGRVISRGVDELPKASRTVNTRLTATLGGSGSMALTGIIELSAGQTGAGNKPGNVPEKENIVRSILGAIDLQQVDAAMLPDYFTGFLARDITSGKLNLDIGFHLEDDVMATASTVSLQDLMLGERSGPASEFDSSLELAVALLTDPSGLTRFEFPLLQRTNDVAGTYKTALAGFISDVAANPFDLLADIAGASGTALDVIDFEPGSAAITPAAKKGLQVLSVALNKRPALGIHASGGQARQADRTALARQQVQLHVALAASTRPSGRREQTALNFSDPKVQVVLDEFASERLGQGELARLKKNAVGDSNTSTRDTKKLADQDAYYAQVFAALVGREQVSESALRQLARFRTQSVIRQLKNLGIAADRLKFGGTLEAGDQPVSLQAFAHTKPVASPPLAQLK